MSTTVMESARSEFGIKFQQKANLSGSLSGVVTLDGKFDKMLTMPSCLV